MDATNETKHAAEFNPRIKAYIFWVGTLLIAASLVGIPLLLIWCFGLGQSIGRRYYESLKCTLTDRHLAFRKGIFFKIEKTIPLENIQDLTFIENPILNYFDLRILKIETAGHSNAQGSDMKLIGILEAGSFKEKVMQQRDVHMDRKAMVRDADNDDQVVALLTEIRDLLKK